MDRVIKCIAIDDEPIALSVIEQFCSRFGGMELSVYSDPREGWDAIVCQKPDLVFLDIEMNDVSGLSIAGSLPRNVAVIFTTAYMQYALDGFDLDAVDFLHKPFAYERFCAAMEKAVRRISFVQGHNSRDAIVVNHKYYKVSIPVQEIVYIEAMENYLKIYRIDGSYVLSRMTLKALGAMLPKGAFVRIHRSFIVARDKISEYSRQEVRLFNGHVFPVGRQYASNIDN